MPSDGNTGEVSYVLIVQQPEDKNKGDGEEAIGVYDFDNENEFDDEDVDNLDDKSKIRKIKPSQQVILLEMDFSQHWFLSYLHLSWDGNKIVSKMYYYLL